MLKTAKRDQFVDVRIPKGGNMNPIKRRIVCFFLIAVLCGAGLVPAVGDAKAAATSYARVTIYWDTLRFYSQDPNAPGFDPVASDITSELELFSMKYNAALPYRSLGGATTVNSAAGVESARYGYTSALDPDNPGYLVKPGSLSAGVGDVTGRQYTYAESKSTGFVDYLSSVESGDFYGLDPTAPSGNVTSVEVKAFDNGVDQDQLSQATGGAHAFYEFGFPTGIPYDLIYMKVAYEIEYALKTDHDQEDAALANALEKDAGIGILLDIYDKDGEISESHQALLFPKQGGCGEKWSKTPGTDDPVTRKSGHWIKDITRIATEKGHLPLRLHATIDPITASAKARPLPPPDTSEAYAGRGVGVKPKNMM